MIVTNLKGSNTIAILQNFPAYAAQRAARLAALQLFPDQKTILGFPADIGRRIRTLEEYRMPTGVIERLRQKYPFDTMTAEQLDLSILEFKRFVAILIINDGKDRRTEMVSELVDEIWHTFILFTKEYRVLQSGNGQVHTS